MEIKTPEQRKNNPPQPEGTEKRVFHIQFRDAAAPAEGDDPARRTVSGYAAVFNSPSEDIGFIEIIEPGAFRDAIAVSDVRALFNHDPNLILARTASGTLRIQEDDKGLRYEFDIPDTTFGNDFRVMLQRGDVSQSSFSFTVKEQAWEYKKLENGDVQYTRRVKKVERLYDVSPVTYPAYPDTEVALRSLQATQKPEEQPEPTPDQNHRARLLAAIERAAK
ncbi:MAG TPA: HK97 family phage prohead protease [Elusimicrobiota bacterium]|nr:HK97 family phage prohead protease [Elusimicrobiota bacterium]